jgi:hypothetical protein
MELPKPDTLRRRTVADLFWTGRITNDSSAVNELIWRLQGLNGRARNHCSPRARAAAFRPHLSKYGQPRPTAAIAAFRELFVALLKGAIGLRRGDFAPSHLATPSKVGLA